MSDTVQEGPMIQGYCSDHGAFKEKCEFCADPRHKWVRIPGSSYILRLPRFPKELDIKESIAPSLCFCMGTKMRNGQVCKCVTPQTDGSCCLRAHMLAKAPWTCECLCHERHRDTQLEDQPKDRLEAWPEEETNYYKEFSYCPFCGHKFTPKETEYFTSIQDVRRRCMGA